MRSKARSVTEADARLRWRAMVLRLMMGLMRASLRAAVVASLLLLVLLWGALQLLLDKTQ